MTTSSSRAAIRRLRTDSLMRFVAVALAFVFLTACGKAPETNSSAGSAKRYPLKGKVVSVDKSAKKAKIDHEAIEGYMPAMEMEFPIHENWVWDELRPGSDIRAELVVDNTAKEPYWLEKIGIIAHAGPDQAQPPINDKFAQIGNPVPDFVLTNQDGKRISIKDFSGKALAITFIYARCPLPDYCIRMSTNFSDVANILNKEADPQKYALLSISFDPENDTPEKLKSYGLGYLGKGSTNLGIWQLAVGKDAEVRKIADFFGLRYETDANDKAQINHSLRTAVIGPDGKVVKIFAGNEWSASELLSELQSLAR